VILQRDPLPPAPDGAPTPVETIAFCFDSHKSGWFEARLVLPGQVEPPFLSDVYDPLPPMLEWLRRIARGDVACLSIDQEGDVFDMAAEPTDPPGTVRLVERTYAHHHPDHMKRAKSALAMQIAKTGAASTPMIAVLAGRDPEALKDRRCGRQRKSVRTERRKPAEGDHDPLADMVGAAGIEPATPTMSRAEAARLKREKSKAAPQLKLRGKHQWR
jgi:hypothetical protein